MEKQKRKSRFCSYVPFLEAYLFVCENIKKALPFGIGRIFVMMLISDSLLGRAVSLEGSSISTSSENYRVFVVCPK